MHKERDKRKLMYLPLVLVTNLSNNKFVFVGSVVHFGSFWFFCTKNFPSYEVNLEEKDFLTDYSFWRKCLFYFLDMFFRWRKIMEIGNVTLRSKGINILTSGKLFNFASLSCLLI